MADELGASAPVPFTRLGLEQLEILSSKAQSLIEAARDAAVEPNHRKVLRRFSAPETLQYLGNISIDTLYRRLKKDDRLPQGTQVSPRRREFTLPEIHTLQRAFGIAPRRPPGKRPMILSICNFKGGVAKTTTTAHLAQYLCLHGYRVLAVDLDAQASLTQMFGILPHTEVPSAHTARPFFEGPGVPDADPNPDWTGTLATAIQKTHWDQLDLIPSNLGLYGAEFSIAARIRSEENFLFYRILADALDTVKDEYDVILLDTAPSLSFVNSNALYAADALVITLPPAFLDLQSASLFYELIADVVRTINQVQGDAKSFEFGAVLLTRFKPSDAVHQRISSWIRSYLSDTFTHAMLQTVVLEKLGPRLLTLYEVDHSEESAKYEGDRRAYERALEAMNNCNAEIAAAIQAVWERQAAAQSPSEPRVHALRAVG
ncbi:MAG TPA: AAA family ATPase [Steroidobacteraceae bacterium]|nr:AAA family ATPase [Steroidobacteraceae bacterium]